MIGSSPKLGPAAMTSGDVVCISRAATTWSAKCSCDPCRTNYRRVRKLRHNGLYTRVPVEAGLAALDRMMRLEYDGLALASATGVNRDTCRGWMLQRRAGQHINIGPKGCLALITAKPPTAGLVGGKFVLRKLQALAVIGWSVGEVARILQREGLTATNRTSCLQNLRTAYAPRVSAELSHAVDDLYRRYATKDAPYDRSHNFVRNVARSKGWASAAAWDNINDPDDTPRGIRTGPADPSRHRDSLDELAVQRCVDGDGVTSHDLTSAERRAVVAILRRRGVLDGTITKRTGITQLDRYPRELPPATEAEAS